MSIHTRQQHNAPQDLTDLPGTDIRHTAHLRIIGTLPDNPPKLHQARIRDPDGIAIIRALANLMRTNAKKRERGGGAQTRLGTVFVAVMSSVDSEDMG